MGEFTADDLTEEQLGEASDWLQKMQWEGGVVGYFIDYNGIVNATPEEKALLKPECIQIIQDFQDMGYKVSDIFTELEDLVNNHEKENE